MVDNLAEGNILKWDEIYKVKAVVVFTKLNIEHSRALYQKELEKIRKRKSDAQTLSNK